MYKIDVYRKYIFDEMSKNKDYNIKDLESLILSLNFEQAKQFCKFFSYYRKNGVYDFISKGPDIWREDVVDISNIDVGPIHFGINPFLEENAWSLKKITKDKRIVNSEEFKSQGPIHRRSLSFIAKKIINEKHHRYRIIDGMHRIIRLACDNKKEFKLVYYRVDIDTKDVIKKSSN